MVRAGEATAAYRPVREQIERRLEQFAAEVAERREQYENRDSASGPRAERRAGVLREVAQQNAWLYAIGDGAVVWVWRDDVAPDPPIQLAPVGHEPQDAYELETELLRLHREMPRRIVWDPRAQAAVGQACLDRGEKATFAQWRAALASGQWDTSTSPTGPIITHVSSRTTAATVPAPTAEASTASVGCVAGLWGSNCASMASAARRY
jgi:hypothetical protein